VDVRLDLDIPELIFLNGLLQYIRELGQGSKIILMFHPVAKYLWGPFLCAASESNPRLFCARDFEMLNNDALAVCGHKIFEKGYDEEDIVRSVKRLCQKLTEYYEEREDLIDRLINNPDKYYVDIPPSELPYLRLIFRAFHGMIDVIK